MAKPADICSLSLDELTAIMTQIGEPAFRAQQIFEWIYKKNATSYDQMSSLSKELRSKLEKAAPFPVFTEITRAPSCDGTIKFLWGLDDDQRIETVYIPMDDHGTLCISSQVGCRMSCKFCASGIDGLERNLTPGEMVGQVLMARTKIAPQKASHIVFMGIGEPFDNYDNVMKAVRLLNALEGFNIAARRITVSTSGVIPGIQRFAKEKLQVELCVSLHAADDVLRSKLMPVNQKFPFDELIAACRTYAHTTNRQVTFQYILIKGLTCTEEAADKLHVSLSGWLCKLNLIPLNPVVGAEFTTPSRTEVNNFMKMLKKRRIHATLRTPRGRDVAAACGQLRAQNK